MPFLIWLMKFYFLCAWLMQMWGRPNPFRSVKGRLLQAIRVRSSMIDFSFVFDEVDVAQLHMLQFCLQTVLRSLVENSVVGATAALIDDARKQVWERTERR